MITDDGIPAHWDEHTMEINLEELKEEVDRIAEAVETIAESEISYEVLYLLIQHSAGFVGNRRIPIHTIKAVLEGMEELQEFVFPTEGE